MPVPRTRPAREEDGPRLQRLEVLAGERFREVGLDVVADDEPPSLAELASAIRAGRCWVAVDHLDAPIGYALADVVDGGAHLEQVTVHPDRQGHGLGRALVERVRDWAATTGFTTVTLTTYADVPWNGPLYAHLGFRVLEDDELGPQLRALRAAEAAHGLDVAPRVAMVAAAEPPDPAA